MRDLLPAEAAAFARLEAVIAARAARYGYLAIESPTVEDRDVFLRTAGEASDAAGKEMYDVSLHGEGGLALRPEATAAVTRVYLQHGMHRAPQPVRLYCAERMYRGQRPQLLRYREFRQWDLECFGAPEAAADVEIVAFTSGLLAELGLVDVRLKVNTIGDEASRPRVKETLVEYFSKYESELDASCRERLRTSVLRIFDCKVERDREIAAGAPKVRDLLGEEDTAHFASVLEGIERLGIAYEVDDTLVRGFDYYTRTVFEHILTDPGFAKAGEIAVAGGGRYDGLVRTMGGPQVAGTGVAGGLDVLYEALKQQGVDLGGDPAADVYVVSGEPGDAADRMQLAEPLRDAGFTVAVDYTTRPLDRQLERAVKHGAKVAVIRGTAEARGGNVIVRDLTKKEQRVTRLAAVVTEVGRHVARAPRPTLATPGIAREGR
ncbi:MAG: histidine--tRNA ligase [Chloroflexota bacterium]|nr:histidine--tRNA ligase [Chloroflexota bacterium]